VTVAAVLLAAGESSRMGVAKPLLPWFGRPLALAQIASLIKGGADDVYVVTGKSDMELRPLLKNVPHVHRVHNPHFAEGKTTSVKAGVAALPEGISAIVLLAVDQPRPAWVVRRVLESHIASGKVLTSPRNEGHGGHPLVFAASLRAEFAAITEDQKGIRAVFNKHAHEMNRVEFDSEIVRLDLNTPKAYREALLTYEELSREP
jgi:molybdenum cofactor cytidylyltransferase